MNMLSDNSLLPKIAIFNLIIECAFGFGIGVWNIALNFHFRAFGLSPAEIGLLISVGFFATAISSSFCGRLSDKIGFSKVSALGGIMVSISLFTISHSSSYQFFYIAQIIYGSGLACIMSTDSPLITSLVLPHQKQLGYNLTIFTYFLSSVAGSLFAGFFPKMFPLYENPYKVLLIISATSYLILGCTRVWLPKQPLAGRSSVKFLDVLKSKNVLSFLLFGFVMMTIFNCIMSMLNLILRERYGLGDDIVGSLYSLVSISGCMAIPILSLLYHKYSNYQIASATLAIQIVIIFLMAFAHVWLFIILVCMRTIANNFVYATVDNPMLQSIEQDRRGSYSGLRVSSNYIGMSLGSAISGYFISKGNYAGLFILTALFCFLQNLIFHQICVPHIVEYNDSKVA